MDTWTDAHDDSPWTARKAWLWSGPALAALRSALILNHPLDEFIGDGRNPAYDPDHQRSLPVKKPYQSPPRKQTETYGGIPDATHD